MTMMQIQVRNMIILGWCEAKARSKMEIKFNFDEESPLKGEINKKSATQLLIYISRTIKMREMRIFGGLKVRNLL